MIDPQGDLTLRLYNNNNAENIFFEAAKDGKPIRGQIVIKMRVSRKVMSDNSLYFKKMLTKDWSEALQTVIDLESTQPGTAELWFRAYHGNGEISGVLFKPPIVAIWDVIQYAGFLQCAPISEVDFTKLQSWFAKVLEIKNPKEVGLDDIRKLLYPCYVFNHAHGFATMTRRLAYEVADHITESNPTEHRFLHLDGNAIGGSGQQPYIYITC